MLWELRLSRYVKSPAMEKKTSPPDSKPRHHPRKTNIMLHVGCLHEEVLSFLVLELSTVDVVLGRPWLTQHSPCLDWRNKVLQWSGYCLQYCLPRISSSTSFPIQMFSTSVKSSEPAEKPSILPEYRVFQNVFRGQAAT